MAHVLVYLTILLLPLFLLCPFAYKKPTLEELKPKSEKVNGNDIRDNIVNKTKAIIDILKNKNHVVIDDIDSQKHYLAPHVTKATWTDLGNCIV